MVVFRFNLMSATVRPPNPDFIATAVVNIIVSMRYAENILVNPQQTEPPPIYIYFMDL